MSERKIDSSKILEDYLIPQVNEQEEPTQEMVSEEISVYYPEQVFAPIPYNSFRCGNLWYKTIVLPGETREQAYQRAWQFVSARVKEQYAEVKKDWYERYEGLSL